MFSTMHRLFARMHGIELRDGANAPGSQDLVSAYAAYADSTMKASAALRKHGKASAEFAAADVESMRLFHRVKKMQGLKKPKTS